MLELENPLLGRSLEVKDNTIQVRATFSSLSNSFVVTFMKRTFEQDLNFCFSNNLLMASYIYVYIIIS